MTTPNSLPAPGKDYFLEATYLETVEYLQERLPPALKNPEVGIVCGSGLSGLVETLEQPIVQFLYKDIPNFPISTVVGHVSKLVFGFLSGRPTVCMVGRMHLYEGHALTRTVFPIRIMKLLGCDTFIATNAAGGLNPSFAIGDIMLISDHISFGGLGGANALIGPNLNFLGPRFPPVSDAYDFNLRIAAVRAARAVGIPSDVLREGIYAFVPGPSYESRAESRFLRSVGADVVGMSTVPEVIVARHCGMRTIGITLVTNRVAVGKGRSAIAAAEAEIAREEGRLAVDEPVGDDEGVVATHAEVLETSRVRSLEMQALVKKLVELSK
ncbi:nucleoside phosphorylase domain-containing protein [Blyttiomyces helicus]|uniref:Purine nucleoside phosphorylase n=1 Tax=Blyttiomyces helicus TaxID=388810 RepID=A0A4P9VXF1_9FUNG|nr:nucleoside phosphorylase domain-containing protein [Blyttiomyces helicus]|eukprot:RKO83922.1 nucleoside phosphorylase domain-containing protein [Blyttiomyces helicus]